MKVVITTCDEYNWLIPVFLHFYRKNWAENPYLTEIITETEHIDGTVFYAGKISWVNRLLNYLKQFEDEKLLFIGEDNIIESKIDTDRIKEAENLCEGQTGCVRMIPPDKSFYRHSIKTKISGFREYPLNKSYSFSFLTSIWKKQLILDVFQDIEKNHQGVWACEIEGTKRLNELRPKWRTLWAETPIINTRGGGLIKKRKFRFPATKWALMDLTK